MPHWKRNLLLCALVGLVASSPTSRTARGEEAPGSLVLEAAKWPTDRVILTDGKIYEGLIRDQSESEIDFLKIVRRPGRPTSFVGYRIRRERVDRVEELTADQRTRLSELIEQYSHRRQLESITRQSIQFQPIADLGPGLQAGKTGRGYRGAWFTLASTADEESLRTAIVRIEERFAAYRRYLPPRHKPAELPHIVLFGSRAEYQTELARRGWRAAHPALYDPEHNVMLAYSELGQLADELEKVRAEHQELRLQYEQLAEALAKSQQEIKELLADRGAKRDELLAYQRLRSKRFRDEVEGIERQVAECERRNLRLLDEQTDRTLRTLYHEAFHAYLENYVFRHNHSQVPRWLNEGLAQIFAGGLLEAGQLRLDAPDADLLARLHQDLKSRRPLPLAELLTAPANSFLGIHGTAQDEAARHYLYSWGLSYYLTFGRGPVSQAALERYVHPGGSATPVARFVNLTGQPLDEFERNWHEYLGTLDAPKSAAATPTR